MMYKKFVFYILSTFIVGASFSQDHSTFSDSKRYIDTSHPIPSYRKYYFLELNNLPSKKIINFINGITIRKLSDKEFIVIKEKFLQTPLAGELYSHFIPANNLWKLSPLTEHISVTNSKALYRFSIQLENMGVLTRFLQSNPDFKQKIFILPGQQIISMVTNYQIVEKYFLNNDDVTGIDMNSSPQEELATPEYDLSANKVNVVHSMYPNINGEGVHVSIKEQYYDTSDIDIKGRYEFSPLASTNVTNHANFIATIIAGAGNSIYYAKGAAWAANISSSSFEQVLPDPDNYYLQKNISVQNHSYGTAIENNYGINAVAFDKSANTNQELLHVFSSGNSGTSTSSAGNYTGIAGFANLTGNFKMAKNALVVGAVDSFGNAAPLSSRGPAYDGRIKPEIVAFQKNGTSEAAAIVSGTALLLQQYYKEKNNSVLPAALAKSILVTSADDVNNPGPDFTTGFGNMNAEKAMNVISSNKIFSGMATQGSLHSFQIPIPANISQVKITLAWNDTAALSQAPKALVNDLDLELTLPSTGERWKPWVLNSIPNNDSLNSVAQRKRDSLNNLEQVTLRDPVQGNYQIDVHGFNVITGTQKFYMAYSLDSSNYFKWQRLTDSDFAEGGKQSILRWQSSFPGSGDIDYRFISINNWIPVASADLSKNYYSWSPPDTIAEAELRMRIGNEFFYSDTFLITKLLSPKIGFVCADSILLYWDKAKNIDHYQVYQLGQKYMEPLIKVTDTAVIIFKNTLSDRYLAVAPVLPGGRIAPKSYALNYDLQGAGCFINAFLVNANGNVSHLYILLGSVYNVVSISFEKLTTFGFITIYTAPVSGETQFAFDFVPLTPGVSVFRAKIILSTGQVIYSHQENVAFAEPGKYLVYPVPTTRNTGITVFTNIPEGEIITVTDVIGRVVLQRELQFPYEHINTAPLQKGVYFYSIIKSGTRVASGKLVIL
jgi:Subtilase family/Secretion system C-terminal sorting domain